MHINGDFVGDLEGPDEEITDANYDKVFVGFSVVLLDGGKEDGKLDARLDG